MCISYGYKGIRGQALPEYIVGVLVVMVTLFIPVPLLDNQTAVEFLVSAFQKNFQGYEYVMSQPASE